MSVDYTTVGLIANCKRRASLPAGSGFTDNDFLQVLSEQLRNYIPAFLKGIREEFIIAQASATVTSATVPLPARACGAALRTVSWTMPDGSLRDLPRVEPERRHEYGVDGSEPRGYMFQGNNVILLPAVTSGTLVVSYQQRPGQLVLPTSCGTVATLEDAYTLGFSSLPADFTDARVYDIVEPVANFKLFGMDLAVNNVTHNSDPTPSYVEFTDTVPSGVYEGCYVCLAGETPIPQIPYEVHDLLAQAAAYNIAASTGSTRTGAIKEALKDLREQVTTLLSPRSDGSARVAVSRSRIGRMWR